MIRMGHHEGRRATPSKALVALIVLAKLAVLAGAVVLIESGTGVLGASGWVIGLHGVVLAAVLAVILTRTARPKVLLGSPDHRKGDHSKGIVLHGAAPYDLLVRVVTFGRERQFRELMLSNAGLKPGESVLDVACGTGALAIVARRQVGSGGTVTGIDASEEMIARARRKAESAGLDVVFVNGVAQELQFEDQQFDVVLGTMMLHHLSKPARLAFVREAHRVLKPQGRLLLIDFGRPPRGTKLPRLHRHGHVDMTAIASTLANDGFRIVDSGELGAKNLSYVRAKPTPAA
jgi:ubiquinone/menaquinone biosynthesis C-methylase UbiE